MSHFVLFLIALLLWGISLFLVAEAAKTQKWALGDRDGVPDPYSGVAMAQLLSMLFIVLWFGRIFVLTQPSPDPIHFVSQLLVKPEQLTPGILLAVFPPVIVGLVKLITALVVSPGEVENPVQRRNRLWMTSVFTLLHIIIAIAAALILKTLLAF